MFYGMAKDGNRVHIRNADSDANYYCPCCKSLLIQKRGQINVWHFAHKTLADCVSYYDGKSEWHRKMQELFPEKNREVYNNEFGRHFYDVLTDKNRIIEFQHSPISVGEFEDRTECYRSHSLANNAEPPVWVFDWPDKTFYLAHRGEGNFRTVVWSRPSHLFYDGLTKDMPYCLWIRMRCTVRNLYTNRETKTEPAYMRVMKVSHDNRFLSGPIFTEQQFEQKEVYRL